MVGRRWDPGGPKKEQRNAALWALIKGRSLGALRALMRGRRKQSVYAFVVIQQMSLANTTDAGANVDFCECRPLRVCEEDLWKVSSHLDV